jgi:DNA-binding LacI/PurR family transcriptional regulator
VLPVTLKTQPETVNLKQLAEHVRLTPGTVSAVLNNASYSKSIPQCTRDRILAAAEELNYKPNFFARSLRVNKGSRLVAVLSADLRDARSAQVIAGIEEHLREREYFMVSGSHRQNAQSLKQYSAALMQRGVEGFITINLDRSQALPSPQVSVDFSSEAASGSEAVVTVISTIGMQRSQADQPGGDSASVVRGPVNDIGKAAAAALLERIALGKTAHVPGSERAADSEPACPGFSGYRENPAARGIGEPGLVAHALTAKPLPVG